MLHKLIMYMCVLFATQVVSHAVLVVYNLHTY